MFCWIELAVAWRAEDSAGIGWLVLELFFQIIFTAECVIKLIDEHYKYFCDGWNMFEFFLVVTGLTGIGVNIMVISEDMVASPKYTATGYDWVKVLQVFKLSRILRLYRLTRFWKILHTRMFNRDIDLDMAEHMQKCTMLSSFIKAHIASQELLVKYFGRDGKVDSVELARCILQSQLSVYKAMLMDIDEKDNVESHILGACRIATECKVLVGELETFVMDAHTRGVITRSDAESIIHHMHHRIEIFTKTLIDAQLGVVPKVLERAQTFTHGDIPTEQEASEEIICPASSESLADWGANVARGNVMTKVKACTTIIDQLKGFPSIEALISDRDSAVHDNLPPALCPGGCGFQITWHETHCCGRCAHGDGHGDHCDKRPMPGYEETAKRSLLDPHRFKEGDIVKIVKEGSSMEGKFATVIDPSWKGLIKVTMDDAEYNGEIKSYMAVELELVKDSAMEGDEEAEALNESGVGRAMRSSYTYTEARVLRRGPGIDEPLAVDNVGVSKGRSLQETQGDRSAVIKRDDGTSHGTSHGKKLRDVGNVDETMLTGTFKPAPGKLGLTADWDTGDVKRVIEGGQAHRNGVEVGMQLRFIAGAEYSYDRLEKTRTGQEDYTITFARPSSRPSSLGDRQPTTLTAARDIRTELDVVSRDIPNDKLPLDTHTSLHPSSAQAGGKPSRWGRGHDRTRHHSGEDRPRHETEETILEEAPASLQSSPVPSPRPDAGASASASKTWGRRPSPSPEPRSTTEHGSPGTKPKAEPKSRKRFGTGDRAKKKEPGDGEKERTDAV